MKKFSKLVAVCGLALSALTASAATFVGDRTDFRDETIYFAMTTRFYDGDPKNNVCSWDKQDVQIANNDPDWRGDFAGLIKKLDYIKALGFTAIWITPIVQNASGEDYHGYHSMDFKNVDLRYESRKEWGCAEDVKFADLIREAHARDMKVILDIVLQHTSNFGDATLNPLFTRDQKIWNQATPAGALIPNEERLSHGYFDQTGAAQYAERFKFFKNPQYDVHNYYHHYGTGWNWDLPNRWWGQIAGDCVDLNTENNTVANYLVEAYEEFIKLGVDGFRIDTTGHIARLTFNKQFIPKFIELGEKYKGNRKGNSPFYMFGECCARYGGVIYRDQHNLSSHWYTWKSPQNLLDQYDGSQAYWDTQVLNEGHDSPVGPMVLCEQETEFNENSSNVFMQNGRWHEPDYSKASGFNVIDFPMHYNFNDAGSAIRIANEGDKYYNDASWNVVYVDSHDYAPGPNDDKRFTGGTEQWAENLSLMFTFRGIPCIYYGSEVEFKAGKPIDVGGENNKTPRKESGRAYFGEYIEGDVTIKDFADYTFPDANANIAKTLNGDLSFHIQQLNKIRAAVPALRKGQYTFEGVSNAAGHAFKRAWKDSYACVAINGGATFSNLPAGTYTELVTGTVYNNVPEGGSITLTTKSNNKGQLRVAVKNFTGDRSKIGEGKFIYGESAKAHGGAVTFPDKGVNEYYTAADVEGRASVSFSHGGGSFRSETLTVTATLSKSANSGWIKVGNGAQQNIAKGSSVTFTIGAGMNHGESVTVYWGADDQSGSVTYKKVDPNSGITIYMTSKDGADVSGTHLHAWNDGGDLNGLWPGAIMTDTKTADGKTYYYKAFDVENINVIFSKNGQTGDIKGITQDACFEYDGGTGYKQVPVPNFNEGPQKPTIKANPASGKTFTDQLSVALSVTGANDIYYTLNGSEPSKSSTKYNGAITLTETTTIKAYAENEAGSTTATFTYTKTDTPVTPVSNGIGIYVTGKNGANISGTNLYAWNGDTKLLGNWPGKALTETKVVNGKTFYYHKFDESVKTVNIIFKKNDQTGNFEGITKSTFYEYDGYKTATVLTGYEEEVETTAPVVSANPASGTTFTNNITVTLSVSPAADIYYTLDGSQPSMSSTRYNGPITLSATTTIKTYVKDVNGERTQQFTYTKSDRPTPIGEYVAYFNNSNNWSNVYAYCWDDNHVEDNSFSGKWGGKKLTETITYNGETLYVFKFTFDGELKNPKIIFHANENNDDKKSSDMDFVNGGIYKKDGKYSSFESGVNTIGAQTEVKVFVEGGNLVIVSNGNTVVNAYKVDGTMRQLPVSEGYNYYEMPKGFYIVNGKKVAL